MEEYKYKVSVIVPVYNVEEYLYDCLNSLIKQTFDDFEIICIDDCSTDSSYEILEYFKTKDNRFKIIKNRDNIGLGASRNVGIEESKGEYILFLDSDDWLDRNTIEELYALAYKNETDVVMFKLINYDQDKEIFYKSSYYCMDYMDGFCGKIFNHTDISHNMLFRLPESACNKLFKSSFIKDNELKFPEGLIHEDNPFNFEMLFAAKKILLIDEYFYNRRIRSNSITRTNDVKLIDVMEVSDIILSFFLTHGVYHEYISNITNFILQIIMSKFYAIDTEHKDDFYKSLKQKIDKFAYVYDLKNDFEKYLNVSNKNFFNLVLYSNTLNEFDKNVTNKKSVKSDYPVSIIIPTYNAKTEEILKAFNSIKSQTIGFKNLEVIFVDDASTFKDSFPILQKLNDSYINIKSIFLKENRGAGNARNNGIDIAKGKYIMFLDHDDFFFKNSCEILYHTINKEKVDIVCGNYINHQRGGKINWSNIHLSKYNKANNVCENMNFFKVDPSTGTKIYRKEFLNSNNLRYKDFKSGQDLYFNHETLFKAEGLVFIDEPMMEYIVRNDANENLSSMSIKNSKEVLESLLNVYSSSYNLFLEYNEEYKYIPLNILNYFTNSRLLNSKLSYKEFKTLLSPFTELFGNYLENPKVNHIQKNEKLFECISKKEFLKAYNIYHEEISN